MTAPRHRYRVRFRKEGDLRLVSHRDLLRALERLLRRAGLALGMSEGFHPKPRLTFPLALSLGVRGIDEVLELELTEELPAPQLLDRLNEHSVPGLVFTRVEYLPTGTRKAQVAKVTYEFPLAPAARAETEERARALLAAAHWPVARPDRQTTVDLRPWLDEVSVDEVQVRFSLWVSPAGTGRPREVLAALGLAEGAGPESFLTRSAVVLGQPPAELELLAPAESLAGAADEEPEETRP